MSCSIAHYCRYLWRNGANAVCERVLVIDGLYVTDVLKFFLSYLALFACYCTGETLSHAGCVFSYVSDMGKVSHPISDVSRLQVISWSEKPARVFAELT